MCVIDKALFGWLVTSPAASSQCSWCTICVLLIVSMSRTVSNCWWHISICILAYSKVTAQLKWYEVSLLARRICCLPMISHVEHSVLLMTNDWHWNCCGIEIHHIFDMLILANSSHAHCDLNNHFLVIFKNCQYKLH